MSRALTIVTFLAAVSALAILKESRQDGASRPASVDHPRAESAPARGDQVRIAMMEMPSTLLEPFTSTLAEVDLAALTQPTLTNLVFDGEISHVPALAERWERSLDGKEIVFYLKDGKWDDGKPMTAGDVVFTYKLVGREEFASPHIEYLHRIESVEAIGGRAVRFKYKTSYYYPNQLSDANVGILPEHVYEKLEPKDVRGTDLALAPVGHGPFKVVSRFGNRTFILERNENVVTTPVPWLRRVVFHYVTNPEAAKNAMIAGEVDAYDTSRLDDADQILASGGFAALPRGLRNIDYIAWDHKHPLFAEYDIRKALTLAIDREGMNRVLFRSAAARDVRVPVGTVPPLVRDAIPEELKPLPCDRAEADRLLTKHGWVRGKNGVRARDGKSFTFTLIANSDNPRRARTASMIQQDLNEVGVKVELDTMPYDAFLKRVAARSYDAAIYGFSSSLYLKQGEVWGTGAPYNLCHYSNSKADALIAAVREENDPAKLRVLLKDLQRIVYDDLPATFLCWYPRVTVVRDRFKQFGASVFTATGDLHSCYVPRALQKAFAGE